MYAVSCDPLSWLFFFQAEDGIRDLVRSRGLGDVYKRQVPVCIVQVTGCDGIPEPHLELCIGYPQRIHHFHVDGTQACLLYTSDAADERSSVDLGGRRIIKKKKKIE